MKQVRYNIRNKWGKIHNECMHLPKNINITYAFLGDLTNQFKRTELLYISDMIYNININGIYKF